MEMMPSRGYTPRVHAEGTHQRGHIKWFRRTHLCLGLADAANAVLLADLFVKVGVGAALAKPALVVESLEEEERERESCKPRV